MITTDSHTHTLQCLTNTNAQIGRNIAKLLNSSRFIMPEKQPPSGQNNPWIRRNLQGEDSQLKRKKLTKNQRSGRIQGWSLRQGEAQGSGRVEPLPHNQYYMAIFSCDRRGMLVLHTVFSSTQVWILGGIHVPMLVLQSIFSSRCRGFFMASWYDQWYERRCS